MSRSASCQLKRSLRARWRSSILRWLFCALSAHTGNVFHRCFLDCSGVEPTSCLTPLRARFAIDLCIQPARGPAIHPACAASGAVRCENLLPLHLSLSSPSLRAFHLQLRLLRLDPPATTPSPPCAWRLLFLLEGGSARFLPCTPAATGIVLCIGRLSRGRFQLVAVDLASPAPLTRCPNARAEQSLLCEPFAAGFRDRRGGLTIAAPALPYLALCTFV